MASFHFSIKKGKKGAAADHAAYIVRTGKYGHKDDLLFSGHGNMPVWAQGDPMSFWRAGDKFERKNGAVYREYEIALPKELNHQQLEEVVFRLIHQMVGGRPYQYAVHAKESSLGRQQNVHIHLMFSDRMDDGIVRDREQTFKRYNAWQPELGGCRKASGGRDRATLRTEVVALREQCASIQNQTLEKYGHAGRVDHRTLKLQGITRAPERHMGAARIQAMAAIHREAFLLSRGQGG
ncbi:MobA/MobL family protein [Herbaspirillum frisingense]|uniref:MobA/MobL family protein n=1 Tax=Herbaspirillum frisingense TaxID=92645 RepID=UPI001603E349|nr:MobA/MobL family protein [Herbaspirillum frisingense]QNB06079.1 MobA/MobL family protein [Herbaspirillum frisingense]